MLKEMIQQGHQKGMRVIPWFEFGLMAPADSELAKRHPDWLTNRRDGSKIKKDDPNNPIHDRVLLNPFKPEVQQFIKDLVVEVVSNYDVDGIQLDDHFGLPSDFGYDDFTVQLYKKEHPPVTLKMLNGCAGGLTKLLISSPSCSERLKTANRMSSSLSLPTHSETPTNSF
jgi:uncharacterized lipoprotein YddW (UPF0748 family)